jgi:hypothetical protein
VASVTVTVFVVVITNGVTGTTAKPLPALEIVWVSILVSVLVVIAVAVVVTTAVEVCVVVAVAVSTLVDVTTCVEMCIVAEVCSTVEVCTDTVFSGMVAAKRKYVWLGIAIGVDILLSGRAIIVVGVSPRTISDATVEEVELSPTIDVCKGSIVSMITIVIGDAVTVLGDSVSMTVPGASVSVTVRPGSVMVTFAVLVACIVMVVSGSSGVDNVIFAAGEDTSASIGVVDTPVVSEASLGDTVEERLANSVEYGVV